MAASTSLTKTQDRIAAQAGALIWIGTRVYPGYRKFADVENFENTMGALAPEAAGAFTFMLDRIESGGNENAKLAIFAGELVMPAPANTNSTLVDAWDKAVALIKQLEDPAAYLGGEFRPTRVVAVYMGVNEEGLVAFDFGAHGAGGTIEVPFLWS